MTKGLLGKISSKVHRVEREPMFSQSRGIDYDKYPKSITVKLGQDFQTRLLFQKGIFDRKRGWKGALQLARWRADEFGRATILCRGKDIVVYGGE